MTQLHSENLFRKQAIEALARKEPGRAICLMPRPWMWLTWALVLVFIAAAVLVSSGEYARTETARGWVVSSTGIIRVSSSQPARITEVIRVAGETVAKGDALLYLSGEPITNAGTSAQMLRQLREELSEVEKQIKLSSMQQDIDRHRIDNELEALERRSQALEGEQAEHEYQVGMARVNLQRLQRAEARGAIARVDLAQKEDSLSALKQAYSRLQQSAADVDRDREHLLGQKAALPVQSETQRSVLRARMSQLSQDIAEYEARQHSVLTAPVDGTVASLEVTAGNSIVPGQLIMTILPAGMSLSAEVFVPSRAMGFIQTGQRVLLSYDAFPDQEFGGFDGRVEAVSEYVLLPNEVPQTFGLDEASYKVRISIDNSDLALTSGGASLRPGMLLAAKIVLERRNFLDWLLQPLRRQRFYAG